MKHPHLSPEDTWEKLFDPPPPSTIMTESATSSDLTPLSSYFIPSHVPAHREILRVLKANEADTITIIAIGPLTNLALAACEEPETFLKAKEVVVMGGAVDLEGNVCSALPRRPFRAVQNQLELTSQGHSCCRVQHLRRCGCCSSSLRSDVAQSTLHPPAGSASINTGEDIVLTAVSDESKQATESQPLSTGHHDIPQSEPRSLQQKDRASENPGLTFGRMGVRLHDRYLRQDGEPSHGPYW